MGSSLAITHLTYIAHNSTLSARSVQRSVTRHIEARKCRITLSLTRPVILVGASGLGKSTIAQNIAHHAVIHGHTACCSLRLANCWVILLLSTAIHCYVGACVTMRRLPYWSSMRSVTCPIRTAMLICSSSRSIVGTSRKAHQHSGLTN